jgi:MOSC domain-containing protein YiiM
VKVRHLYISPGHNFFGHHGLPAGEYPIETVQHVECVAGRGIQGDRFFDFKQDYKGQITFFALEVFKELSAALAIKEKAPAVLRRNVITEGVDLNTLVGRDFELQGLTFRGMTECAPCYWMDGAFGPGAEHFLQGRGGLRAQILVGGILRVET